MGAYGYVEPQRLNTTLPIVLVTGASGFLGTRVTNALLRQNLSVVAVTRNRPHNLTGYNMIGCDLADEKAVSKLLADTQPKNIINCAAVIDFRPDCLSQLRHVNINLPKVLANYCTTNNAHLIHLSSTAIHESAAALIEIDTPIKPDADYGLSKFMAETTIQRSGCRAAIIRFPGIYGLGDHAHLQLNNAIKQASKGKTPVLHGNGFAKRNYIYVEDAANLIGHVLEKQLEGTYLAAGPEIMNFIGMLEIVSSVFLGTTKIKRQHGANGRDQVIVPHLPPLEMTPMRQALIKDQAVKNLHGVK